MKIYIIADGESNLRDQLEQEFPSRFRTDCFPRQSWTKEEVHADPNERLRIMEYAKSGGDVFRFAETRTHRDIHYLIAEEKDEWAIVIEEGIELIDPKKFQAVCDSLSSLPVTSAIVQLNDNTSPHIPFEELGRGREFPCASGNPLTYSTGRHGIAGVSCYALNREAAREWSQAQTPVRALHVDLPLHSPNVLEEFSPMFFYPQFGEELAAPQIVSKK